MTIASELTTLNTTKSAIKTALEGAGENMGAVPFTDYPDVIAGLAIEPTEVWERNVSWLPLVEPLATEQKIVLLHAVHKQSNFCAFLLSGAYTVDWGDGSTVNVSAGVPAYHEYDYNNVALAGTEAPVTFSSSTDVFTRAAHGLVDGKKIQLFSISAGTPLKENTDYYVVSATTDTFQLAYTPGGAPIALVASGTLTLLPYKQAVVTITAQSGQTLAYANFNMKHSKAGLQAYGSGILDMAISLPSCTDLRIGSSSITPGTATIRLALLERVVLLSHNCSTLSYLFFGCYNLRKVSFSGMSTVTSLEATFSGCNRLTEIHIPATPLLTSLVSTFTNCYNLKEITLDNTDSLTNIQSTFFGCASLKKIPAMNTALVTNMSSTFTYCYSLEEVTFENVANVTSMSSMFSYCWSLKHVVLGDTTALLYTNNMFIDCRSLEKAPAINFTLVSSASSMFSNCYNLKRVNLINTPALASAGSMFNNCFSLVEIKGLNLDVAATPSGIFTNCNSLSLLETTGCRNTFSVASCHLSAAALDAIYTGLPTVTSKVITVTGNHGVDADTPSIATAKGWTVTG